MHPVGDSKDVRRIRRGCTDRDMRALILKAIASGARYRMTKSGVMFTSPAGAASTHFTCSDHRSIENFRANLRSIGITIEKGK